MERLTNRDLVGELQAGARSGVRRLVARYQARLIGEAVRIFRVPRPDAEEIVDDVLLHVVEGVATFEFRKGDGDFHVWVMTIFKNRVRDFMRRRAAMGDLVVTFDEALAEDERLCTEAEREVMGEIVRRYAAGMEEPDMETALARSLEAVSASLDRLESWERVLLRCRALGIPYEEIAGYTGKKPELLRVYHGRVRRKFLALLVPKREMMHARSSG